MAEKRQSMLCCGISVGLRRNFFRSHEVLKTEAMSMLHFRMNIVVSTTYQCVTIMISVR